MHPIQNFCTFLVQSFLFSILPAKCVSRIKFVYQRSRCPQRSAPCLSPLSLYWESGLHRACLPELQIGDEESVFVKVISRRPTAMQLLWDKPRSPPETRDKPRSPPETRDKPRSPPETRDKPRSPPETRDKPRSPPETRDKPRSPPETRDKPRSPPETRDKPRSPPETRDKPRSPPETRDKPRSPPETCAAYESENEKETECVCER
uniref:Uncharacterized protein n=1 Tax=Oncorhynchus kisutch TaxID=8019 RepID=A0A8C7JRZ6_ONCKI